MNNNMNGRRSSTPPQIRKRKPKESTRSYKLAVFIVFLFFFIIISAVIVISLKLSLKVKSGPKSITYTFALPDTSDKEKVKKEYSLSSVERFGLYYVDLNDISELMKLRYVEDKNSVSLNSRDGKEYISFAIGSHSCNINGTSFKMNGPCIEINKSIFVPSEVFEQYCPSVTTNFDEEKIILSFVYEKPETNLFILKEMSRIEGINKNSEEDRYNGVSPTELHFNADIKSLESYMNPYECGSYLLLVNNAMQLSPTYVPSNLEVITDPNIQKTYRLCLFAQKSLEAMLSEARAVGHTMLTVTNAYKDYATIKSEFSALVAERMNLDSSLSKEDAEKKVSETKRRAGINEYQTGLACTIINYGSPETAFVGTDAAKWLEENCWKFGYILRYPENKQKTTQNAYEPWHFRYVGRYHAERMKELGMCLEEYADYINNYKE